MNRSSHPLIALALILNTLACGAVPQEEDGDAAKSATPPPTADAGNCSGSGDRGCIGGFISHGQKITVALLDSGENIAFRDAADIYDRFSEAFVEPAIKKDGRNPADYEIELLPEVKRDNFAIGFYMFLEGSKAYDKKNIDSAGNFAYEGLDDGNYSFRMVKEITLRQKPKAGGEALDQCLVFEYQRDDVAIEQKNAKQRVFQLGSVNSFQFYVRRNYGKCSGSKDLPPIGPSIIPGATTTGSATLKVLGSYTLSGSTGLLELALSGDQVYHTTPASCAADAISIAVYNKSSQTAGAALGIASGCEGSIRSLAIHNNSLYFVAGTQLRFFNLADPTTAGATVDLGTLGYNASQLSGGVIEAGLFYAMEAKDFQSNKIIAFNLLGAPAAAISLSGHDGTMLQGLTKLGNEFYSVSAASAGAARLLVFAATGALQGSYTIAGLQADERVSSVDHDGSYFWVGTDQARLYKLAALAEASTTP